jgi:hypothetical protein
MIDDPQSGLPPWRRALESAVLLLPGAAISTLVVRQALATVEIDWRVDAAVGVMTATLLAPSGIAWLGAARLFLFRRPALWTWSDFVWLATALVELAWCGVWLDNGLRLGHVGKFLCGVTAMLGSPAVAGVAALLMIRSWRRRDKRGDLNRWCGILLALTVGVGWGLFLGVLLPLRF